MSSLFAEQALLTDGWQRNVRIDIDAAGTITAIEPDAEDGGAERAAGPVLPGMPNLHSHAFQRAMAGLAESASGAEHDDFWSWREAMYHLVARLNPEQMHAIAAQLYIELLRGGFTSVAEFHYLHHDPDGTPYGERAETSVQVIEAARRAGIGITHLPVLYTRGGFDGSPLRGGQVRFRADAEAIAAIGDALRGRYAGDPQVAIGIAIHSLRAAAPEDIQSAITGSTGPIHVHAAEQTTEVEECLRATGLRPVQWLLEHAGIDERWCLIHATHLAGGEGAALAASSAVAGLCPTTEANLGDGVFPFSPFLSRGGTFGVGTDSHVGRSAAEELRWLEYGQRLVLRRRNVATTPGQPSTARTLWSGAVAGGAAAVARPVAGIAVGQRGDLLVLDGEHADLGGLEEDTALGAFVFSAGDRGVRDVMVGGHWVIRGGHHPREDEIADGYRAALRALRE